MDYRNELGQLHRLDGPAVEGANGYKAWYKNGQRHRLDGPAVEGANGYKAWYKNGQPHRLDGPAVERSDGTKEWCRRGYPVWIIKYEKRISICGFMDVGNRYTYMGLYKATIAEWDKWFYEEPEIPTDTSSFRCMLELWEQFKTQVDN